jgi:DNA-binding protein HU-beta
MTKAEIVAEVAAATDESQEAVEEIVNSTIDTITGALGGGERVINLGPLGTFTLRDEGAHTGSDPNTHEPVGYPPYTRVLFHPAKALHDAVQPAVV